ncbi:MAG: proline--tRNA ligase [Candidatus Andersenbacteria bacterium CG10_big_fil_rev_8_21_14_0_10_54_11]|uniref:Proline--tRNA ligase n=1 Tax=Candidatus Andersenbacteria bacterium CG10_big_fil_rev_8_21_14_0_10_54_11 TaxID=1974485 RepID=A0A2M6WYH8_9BACT|nr:MAG: proline--tRNA ligase [Candidatus Andersenbacteria bacterium CG10_big_fil_rev_8_21_14_0_10_54_11]
MFEKKAIPKKSDGLSAWYNRVVLEAELADYGPVKGTMIFRPYGYAIWERIHTILDADIRAHGVENAYFPLFIPESFLQKEQQHVKGFSPELAVVTIGGGEELAERLIVRPTSETIMYHTYAKWIQSWRDLPLQINQWNNVVRWEKRAYLFLRTTEFLWQEGHTAHATHEEALACARWAMDMYTSFYRNVLALPGYVGTKSAAEKFAGADMTLTYETLMPEGKALQSCTSHDLGQNFSRPFAITFLDESGKTQYVWQTSWGLSTRSIGALLLAHGDDQGLRLPPRIAPVQVIILPIGEQAAVLTAAQQTAARLADAGIRAQVDVRDNERLGFKINKWELRGVPLRIEIGPREVNDGQATIVRRDTFAKETVGSEAVTARTEELLTAIQSNLHREAADFLETHTHTAITFDTFQHIMAGERGFILAPWCEDPACAEQIKAATKATVRCLPLGAAAVREPCVRCGSVARHRWYFAQAY